MAAAPMRRCAACRRTATEFFVISPGAVEILRPAPKRSLLTVCQLQLNFVVIPGKAG
jgi:hypothetical protein